MIADEPPEGAWTSTEDPGERAIVRGKRYELVEARRRAEDRALSLAAALSKGDIVLCVVWCDTGADGVVFFGDVDGGVFRR